MLKAIVVRIYDFGMMMNKNGKLYVFLRLVLIVDSYKIGYKSNLIEKQWGIVGTLAIKIKKICGLLILIAYSIRNTESK